MLRIRYTLTHELNGVKHDAKIDIWKHIITSIEAVATKVLHSRFCVY